MTQATFDREAIIQATLAEDAYIEHKHRITEWDHQRKKHVQKAVVILPDGTQEKLEVIRDFEGSDKDGFQAAIYYNPKTNTLHGAIRGSETREFGKDWVAADILGMGVAGINTQADSAREFMKVLLETAKEIGEAKAGDNPKINLTGHSLGGSLAQYLAHYAGDRIHRTDTFNAFGVGDLRWAQKVPMNDKVDNVFNHRMAGDIVSNVSQHYGKVIVYEHPNSDGGNHANANFTGMDVLNDINVLAKAKYNLAYKGPDRVQEETHIVGPVLRQLKNIVDLPFDLVDWGRSKLTGVAAAGERATRDGLPEYKAGAVPTPQPAVRQVPATSEPEKNANPPPASSQSAEQKELLGQLSPKAQKLYQQCEEKLIALCHEKGIAADSPQDFKNIAMALTAKAIENRMSKVERMGFGDNLSLHILSHEPQIKTAAVPANDAVNIPIAESMEKIRQSEQQQAQLAQERQMAQSQSHSRGMSLT